MKKLIIAGLLSMCINHVQADVFRGTTITPDVIVYIGDRDRQGNYWDGHGWRDHIWWNQYGQGHLIIYGDLNDRGYRWDGDRWRDRVWWDQHTQKPKIHRAHKAKAVHKPKYEYDFYENRAYRTD